ncbi:hypothetical protein RYX56_05765 [Alkalihalophilus lindianensis]|uniref:Uncharacterized protein n=1 Tax=Alkalihalophilus lindianensis TaxID=1630542 RepID=A0ABU3X7E5_9BACI|nr:hypothetical protein [Alkalihalophilus lindianensis]MDV2683815.1 hypothetical protein [Alkalihalophilus lindianensis]MDV2683881.1 hypothetical protein [Alkalihalophilus lindianensis]
MKKKSLIKYTAAALLIFIGGAFYDAVTELPLRTRNYILIG